MALFKYCFGTFRPFFFRIDGVAVLFLEQFDADNDEAPFEKISRIAGYTKRRTTLASCFFG